MRIGIVGSRSFHNYESFCVTMKEVESQFKISCVVSGGAVGADKLASVYAYNHNIPILEIVPDWQDMSEPCIRKVNRRGEPYNALAGIKRNTQIVEQSDVIVAFWDLTSKGTRDTLKKARDAGKEVIVYNVRNLV